METIESAILLVMKQQILLYLSSDFADTAFKTLYCRIDDSSDSRLWHNFIKDFGISSHTAFAYGRSHPPYKSLQTKILNWFLAHIESILNRRSGV